MQRTTLVVAIDLQATAPPDQTKGAAFAELRQMLKMFRRVPFTTNGEHEEIYIVDIRQVDASEAPD